MRTSEPHKTGIDRILNVAAAYEQMGKACVVVDAGTAVTVDVCNDQGEFLGGAILPGAALQFQAMNQHTAALPKVELADPTEPIGTSTASAMQLGVFHGIRGAVKELVENYVMELGNWPEVIATGGDRYIVPLASVREMLRPTAGMVSRIENRAEVVVIRNRVLPVVRLYERFGTTPRTADPSESVFVVAEADGEPFCLMVDELIGKQEVVIKSLGPVFDGIAGIAGGAILGDGHVGLILDLNGIFGGRADA